MSVEKLRITMKFFGALLAVASIASAAQRTDMLVSTDGLAKHSTDPKVVILHVAPNRTAYDVGHVPGARFVALPDIAVTRDGIPNELPPVENLKKVMEAAGVSDDSRIILYSDASVLPATRAYFTLDYLGHGEQAALLDGGLEKWRREERSITQEAPSPTPGRFTPHPRPELVVQIDAVKQMSAKSQSSLSEVLLDVRPAADFREEKGAHIPGAVNAYWMENQTSHDDQALKPDTELRKLYESTGITPEKRVVTYCNSGMQATQSYFTLKYLGYDVRLYDGSMSEWKSKGAPVEK
jgi:thiosulfate/3-mercaptopyruvate sulfurtransferase